MVEPIVKKAAPFLLDLDPDCGFSGTIVVDSPVTPRFGGDVSANVFGDSGFRGPDAGEWSFVEKADLTTMSIKTMATIPTNLRPQFTSEGGTCLGLVCGGESFR
jgi:hypothetical protein